MPISHEGQAISPQSAAPDSTGPSWLWKKIKRHKVVEWTLAYIAFAYAFLHGAEMLSDAQDWPHVIVRVLSLALILGVPMVALLAWYHGHRAQHRISGPEIVFFALLLVVAGTMLWWLSGTGAARVAPSAVSVNSIEAAFPENSIAVLPFVDLSEKHDQGYFADGMAAELAETLGKIPQLRVVGTASSFRFRGEGIDIPSIARQLRTEFIVEGSVRRSGDHLRISAELLDAPRGERRWSESYDRTMTDVLSVQEEIAGSLARALQIALTAAVASSDTRGNPEAYNLYLKGRHAFEANTHESTDEAIADFRQALALDARNASAAVGLARAFMAIGQEGWITPVRDAFEPARQAAQRALAIDPKLGNAHAALAQVHVIYDWDWGRAEDEARLADTPGSQVEFHEIEAVLAANHAQWESAIQHMKAALALDPLNPELYIVIAADVYLRSGHYVEAEQALRRQVELSPNSGNQHYFLGETLLLEGKLQQALAEFQRETIDDGQYEGSVMTYYAMGRRAESDLMLKRATEHNGSSWASEIARIHAFRGESDEALAWLERAYAARDEDLYTIKNDPLMKKLEGDPRYQAFLRKMNLPE